MSHRYRFAMLPLIALIAFACDEAASPLASDGSLKPAAVTNTTEVLTLPFDFAQFVPCAGETIQWNGELVLHVHVTTRYDAVGNPVSLLISGNATGQVPGTGLTSGKAYVMKYNQQAPLNAIDFEEGTPFTATFVLRMLVRNERGGLVGTQMIRAHTTTTPGGNTVVDRFDFELDCR